MSLYTKAVVATGHELVSKAAAEILAEGGNAFDAVVAAGFAGAVAEQTLTSLGGGGFLLARTAGMRGGGEEIFFDFFVDTPGLGGRQKEDPHFFPVTINFGGSDQVFNVGFASVAVPGTLKGLLHVHQRLGRMDLSEVLAPAVSLAKGHRLNDFQARFLKLLHPIMTLTETGRNLYEPGGRFMESGDTLVNSDIANFLESLVLGAGDSFYSGDLARQIDQDMKNGHGLLTFDDLSSYKVIERKPLKISYHDHVLLTSPPPSLGGSLIGLSLSLLEGLDKPAKWGSPDHLMRTMGLMREVEHLRQNGVFTPDALEQFRNSPGLEKSRDSIRMFSRGTTHISISDQEGNVASMTCSNGEGAGYFVPGTGVMLNNMMGEDDLHPEGFHTGPPGQRVASMMSPSILLKDDLVKLVLGSGGSKRIRTALTQVLTQFIDFDRDITTAVHAPRIHWEDGTLQVEPGFKKDSLAALEKKVPVNIWDERSVYFGGVHSVIPGVEGVGDPRRGGSVSIISK